MTKKVIKQFVVKDQAVYDDKQNTVMFYFARVNVPDLHDDIFLPNSIVWNDISLVKHYKNHDFTQPVGKIISIEQDSTGYYAVSKLIDTTLGRDTLIEYKEGIINQHSLTGYVLDGDFNKDGLFEIKKMELIEVSSLTMLAAQPDTPVIGWKEAGLITINDYKQSFSKNLFAKQVLDKIKK